VYDAHTIRQRAAARGNAQNTPTSTLSTFHAALLDVVGMMNGPQRDELLIREAGIRLDRALFPLLVLVERLGPIGVVELADRVGRDYTTVSRQLAKMETLGLITRTPCAQDKRARGAHRAARQDDDRRHRHRAHRVLRHGFADWQPARWKIWRG
jgi:DNA-binding MarR family transcriptional regulator